MKNDLDPKWGELSPFHDPYILANFKARKTDVLITTAPKAGTTWMQQILHQLRSKGDDKFENIDDVVPWLEWPRSDKTWQQRLEEYETLADPRIFKTHCTYEQTPGVDTARIVLSSRDPRDCCVSFYHHTMNLTDETCKRLGFEKPASFDEYFEQWMNAGVWYRNVKSWWPHINQENLLWLRYEDMKTDLEKAIDELLTFLGWFLSDSEKQNVLKYCSFEWMKQHNDKFVARDENQESFFQPNSFIRKGVSGDHKSLLSDAQAQMILDRANQELEKECMEFISKGWK